MNRMRHMILVAGAIASLTALTVGQASAASIPPRTVEIVGDQDLGAPSGEVFYFKQGRIVVHKDDTVTWKNETVAPHSITIVNRNDVPQTLQQTLEWPFAETFLSAHAPTIGPEGPVPPFVASLDAFKVSAASPARLDSAGDSLVVAEMGAAYPNTFGTFIPDTISAVITAPEGTVLEYVCAIHPWMNGEIQVLKNSEN
jgi:plastocyanin